MFSLPPSSRFRHTDDIVKRNLEAILNNSDDSVSFIDGGIGNNEAKTIATYLEQNTALTELFLGRNKIGEAGAKSLGKALACNQTLKTLDLSENRIGDAGANALGEGLKVNKALLSLDLSNCLLRDDGVRGLAEGLKQNGTLTSLDLQINLIDEGGAKAIADVLLHNDTLMILSLDFLPTSGLLAIACACKTRTRLESLYFNPEGRKIAEAYMNGPKQHSRGNYDDTVYDSIYSIDDDGIVIKDLIGKGNYGSAYLVKYYDKDCVLKYAHDATSGEAVYESALLSCLPEHPNVLRLIGKNDGYYIDGKRRSVLMVEAHNGGSLKDYVLTQKGNIYLSQKLSYCRQMASAIQHLHEFLMLHRDIALRNLVLTEDLLGVVIIDFGLSYVVEEATAPFYIPDGEEIPLKRLPPESLCAPHPYFLSSDIWMLGLAFWELQTGKEPFAFTGRGIKPHRSYLLKKMLENPTSVPLSYPTTFPPQLKELIEFCCQFDFLKRPTAKDVVKKILEMSEDLNADEVKLENVEQTDADTSAKDLLSCYGGIGDYDGGDGYESLSDDDTPNDGYEDISDGEGPGEKKGDAGSKVVADVQKQLRQYYYDVAGVDYWPNA